MVEVKCPSCDASFEEPGATPKLEVISEHEMALLRLKCYRAVVGSYASEIPLATALKTAEILYNWCMEFEEERVEPDLTTQDDRCERKH